MLLAWLPNQAKLQDGFYSWLKFLVRLTRWSDLCTVFSSRWVWERPSRPCPGRAAGWDPRPVLLVFLGTQIRPECALNFLVRWGHQLCSEDRLYSLFKHLCRQGCWEGYAAFCVLWFSSLAGEAKRCVQWWVGLRITFPACSRRSSSKASKSLCLNSRGPVCQASWWNSAIGFVMQTISSSLPSLSAPVLLGGIQELSPALLGRRGWKTLSTASVASVPGQEGEGSLQATLNFPNWLCRLGEARS